MSGLTSLRDQLPLLLVLSPTIGFIATSTATWFEPKWIRPLALSNMICTLVLLGGLEWQFEADLARDANTIRLAQLQLPPTVVVLPDCGVKVPPETMDTLPVTVRAAVLVMWL